MAPMKRNMSAPLRSRSRYRSSVLESALVGIGHEDAEVRSTRKPRKKRRYEEATSPVPRLQHALSVPVQRPKKKEEEEEEDPFAHLHLLKKKKKREEKMSPVLTRSATKKKNSAGVLEMAGCTPVTRSMSKKKRKRSRLEDVDQEDVVVQKKLLFQSPKAKEEKKRKKIVDKSWEVDEIQVQKRSGRTNRKAVELRRWSVEWPPVLALSWESHVEKVRLVFTGRVGGEAASFVVAKREGPRKFTSLEGGYVALSGRLDRGAAIRADMPREVMELMEDGIPAYFHKRLLPFVQKTEYGGRVKTSGSKTKQVKKKARDTEKCCSPMDHVDEYAELGIKAAVSPLQHNDVFTTPKRKKARASALKKKKKRAMKAQPEPESEADFWTSEQLEALSDAKLKIPTVASNFWAQVAQFVPGKSAKDCQTKTFEHFRSPPTNQNGAKRSIKRTKIETNSAVPAKIARAGSNKFKKQVRDFVEEYEKKHVDDLFETTPSKEGLPDLPEFDAIKSPELATPSRSFEDDDSDDDDEAPGLLKKLSSRRRDDIDSYVLGINRQHVAGGGVMAGGKVRRVTTMVTPIATANAKATMSVKNKAVLLEEECGSHSLKGVVSPGGTTRVRVEKDGSSSEEEDYYSSEEEEDFDLPDH